MKTILATTDFSPVSVNAMYYATDMAREMNANLVLLHVLQFPISYSEIALPTFNYDEMLGSAELMMKNLENDLQKRADGKIKISGEVIEGSVAKQIRESCSILKPDLVIMGAHSGNAIETFVLGSNSIWAMKNLQQPLLIIPQKAKFTHIQKIGLACDMKNVTDELPLDTIKKIVHEFNARLHVLHVNREYAFTPEVIEESGSLLYALDDIDPAWHFLDKESVDESLNSFAEENGLDLLIVVPKKHAFIERLFHKSQSRQMALHTHLPLLVVHCS